MKIKSGQDRIVILLPAFGIALKFPRIKIFRFLAVMYQELSRGCFREAWSWPVEVYGSPKKLLFKGFMDNWREWQFWRKTKHEFLQPTLLSLCGLMNVQLFGKPCTLSTEDHWAQIYGISHGKSFCDAHHLCNPANFCVTKGRLRILDYGSLKVHAFVSEFGTAIMKHYNTTVYQPERTDLLSQL